MTKAVADAPARDAVAKRSDQGLGHVLIHHYGNTVSPTRVLKLRTATSTQALPSSAGDNSSPVENAKTDPYASST